MRSRIGAIIGVTVIIIASALMSVLAKLALVEVPAFTFAWLQVLSGGICLTLYMLVWQRERLIPSLPALEWAAIVIIGLTNFGLVRIMMMMSLERLPATTYTFLLSFVSLATMVLSALFLRERPGRLQMIGILLAVLGVWLFFPIIPAPQELPGVLYAMLVIAGLATSNNITRWLVVRQAGRITSAQLSIPALSTLALWIGGIPIVAAGLWLDGSPSVGGARNAMIIFANGVVGIAIVLTVFNAMLKTLRSYEASVLAGSGLIWTALLAIPILGEWLELRQVMAMIVMMLGAFLAQWRPIEPAV